MLKFILRPIITYWEKFFSWIENIETVEGSPYGLLRMSTHPYKGKPATLADGTKIEPGDYIIEIHISNLTLAKGRVGDVKVSSDLQLLPLFREEMKNLARLAKEGRLDPQVNALWGVTMLGPGLRRLGFELTPMEESLQGRMIIWWMSFLKWMFAPPSSTPTKRRKTKRKANQYWMSIDSLMQKYQDS